MSPPSASKSPLTGSRHPDDSHRRLTILRRILTLHVIGLIALRLVYEADDFNNWDLVSLLNANAFPSLSTLLALPQVHFANPFSFPLYNTGSESVISILVHRFVGGWSLYWSNVVVLAVYDVVLLAALHRLYRLVYGGEVFLECVAWALVAMSPIVLTFTAISAFDTQGFATLVLGLLGSEYVLRSRPLPGIFLLVVAFVCMSQAYAFPCFLPLFCAVWLLARSMVRIAGADLDAPQNGRRFGRDALLLATAVAAFTMWAEIASHGAYSRGLLRSVSLPYTGRANVDELADVVGRVTILLRAAFAPASDAGQFSPGFAPYFIYLAMLSLVVVAIARSWLRSPRRATPALQPTFNIRAMFAAAAWLGLVLFGYLPGISGGTIKSQRCVFGDIFLGMAVVALAGWVVERRLVSRGAVLVQLLLLLCLSDAYYLSSVASVDHTRNHFPIFDYDTHDSVVRHDLIRAIETMHAQSVNENARLVIYYPRGFSENTTDPALFFGRFLRHFGSYRGRSDVIFPCHFCDVRYGCPFPQVRRKPCRRKCCYTDPLSQLQARPGSGNRKVYLWWYGEDGIDHELRRTDLLAAARQRYLVVEVTTIPKLHRWRCYEVTPRSPLAEVAPIS